MNRLNRLPHRCLPCFFDHEAYISRSGEVASVARSCYNWCVMKSLHIVAPVLALVLFLSPFALEAAKTEIPDLRIVGVTVKKGQGKNPPQGGKGKIRQGEYNVFGLEIAPDALIWFVNGQETFRYPRTGADELQWPFEIPQHLKLDQQLGGKWVGEVAVETLPVATYVDWVRYLVPEERK